MRILEYIKLLYVANSFHSEYECDGGYIGITIDAYATIHLAAAVNVSILKYATEYTF